MEKITTWSPDTCGCVIEYAWDSDDPAETRVHTAHSHDDSGCDRHNHPGTHEAFATVRAENQRKNHCYEVVRAHAAVHAVGLLKPGSDGAQLDGGVFDFRYEPDGALTIILARHPDALKQGVQAAIATSKIPGASNIHVI